MTRRMRLSILVLGVLWCAVAATAAWAAKGPEVGPNVQVNAPQQLFPNDFPSRNTTTLAASEEGQELLAGWDDFQGFCGPPTNRACPPQDPPGLSGFAFSTDGGETWTDGGSPYPIGPAWTAGHPWVDRGGEGDQEIFYFTSRMRTSAVGTNSAGIGIHRGHFGAGTFVWDDAQIINSSNPKDFYSRQSIAAAKDASGAAYIALSNIDEICGIAAAGYGQIEVWRTHDGGDTWQGPVVVSPDTFSPSDPNDPNCGATGTQQVIPVVSIGTQGEVYVVWQYGPFIDAVGNTATRSKLAFSRSLDGGVTFSAPQFIAEYNNNRADPPVGYGKNRMNDQPRMAVAASGVYRGRIYVTFYAPLQEVSGAATAQTIVSIQSYILYSDDQGQTWTSPAAITPQLPATGVKRFWPTPTVRPGGDLDVIFLESQETQATPNPTDIECNVQVGAALFRKGPLSSLVNTYWIQSHDGGVTFSEPLRVSDETSNWCQAAYTFSGGLYSNFGDYLGIGSGGNRTFALWPDGRNGFSDVFFAEIKGKADE
jgi:BNR repeat-like domain